MSLAAGTRLGPYEVADQLGAGGMGEVYRATDTRLDRTVAIKVLPEHLADRADLRERFEREAKAVSSLNHPHICTLFDVGEQDGVHYLVMEYVDGDTLAKRLEKGRLPLDQAIEYAIQMADALDKAHRQGVVHRDLKPGNIMLTKSGTKLLDFGLAKLKGDAAEVSPLSQMPTQDASAPLTAEGTILGTLQYMAPEQLEGKEADARTDIFGFGAVVYEMVTGKKAFEGSSQASLIAAIIEREPAPISELQSMTPLLLDHVVRRCLRKDPEDRWQAASDVMHELKWSKDGNAQSGTVPGETPSKTRERVAWSLSVVLLMSTLALAFVAFLGTAPQEQTAFRFSFPQPSEARAEVLAISPDGERIAFLAPEPTGGQAVWVRELGSGEMRMLAGTEGATRSLFWEPNGQSIGFFTSTDLRVADLSGAAPRIVCPVVTAGGGTWNAYGEIIFAGSGGMSRVSALGGQPVLLEVRGLHPFFLPDGIHFLYSSRPELDSIYLASLESSETRLLLPADIPKAVYATGHVLFVRGGGLMAQVFDLDSLELKGEARRIGTQVYSPSVIPNDDIPLSVSTNGILAFRSGNRVDGQLVWFDREGNETRRVPQPQTGEYLNPSLSPDGQQIAVNRRDPATGNVDIWLIDVGTGVPSRFTSTPSFDADPVWSPDDEHIAYSSYRNGKWGLRKKNISTELEEPLWEAAGGLRAIIAMDWSPNGEFILFDQRAPREVWVLPVSGDDPWPLFEGRAAHFSPDGEWVAYSSREAVEESIYVARFPDGTERIGVTTLLTCVWIFTKCSPIQAE